MYQVLLYGGRDYVICLDTMNGKNKINLLIRQFWKIRVWGNFRITDRDIANTNIFVTEMTKYAGINLL